MAFHITKRTVEIIEVEKRAGYRDDVFCVLYKRKKDGIIKGMLMDKKTLINEFAWDGNFKQGQ